MKISRIKEYLTSPGCFLFLWLPLLIFLVVRLEYGWQTFVATGSFFPSIRGPYYLVITDDSRTTSITDHPGSYGSELLGTAERGQRLEIIGFVKTGGFLHSVVVTLSGKTGFIMTYSMGHEITCTGEDANTKGYGDCLWGLETQLTEYDYDTGVPK